MSTTQRPVAAGAAYDGGESTRRVTHVRQLVGAGRCCPARDVSLSTGPFALLHGLNACFGESVHATVLQVGASFLADSALSVTRLSAGTLILRTVLHAVWDFGTFGSVATDAKPRAVSVIAVLACDAAALLAVPFVLGG